MKNNAADNFKAFNLFKGIGNPDSKVWFMGLEEGGDAISEDNIDEKVKDCYKYPFFISPEQVKATKTQVWDYISKFMVMYSNNIAYDWTSYREIMFCEEHSRQFLTELFPLPKNKFNTWVNIYGSIFGFSSTEKTKYIDIVRKERFPMLQKLWNEKRPDLTICFGKSSWNYFIELFDLNCVDFYKYKDVKIDLNKNIVLIPFLGNGRISNDKIESLAIRLKEQKNALPFK